MLRTRVLLAVLHIVTYLVNSYQDHNLIVFLLRINVLQS